MRPPIRRFAPIGAGTLVIALAAATAFLAAQDRSQPGPKICLTSAGNVSGEGPFLAENDAAMKKMMSGMAITPTGDVDLDFVAMMVPHHQGGSTWPSQSFATVATHRSGGWPRKSSSPSRQEIAAMRLAVGQPLPVSSPAPTQPLSGASHANAHD
jgi:hypothetical protein